MVAIVKPLVWVPHTQMHPPPATPNVPGTIMYWTAETPFWTYKIYPVGDTFVAANMGVPAFPSFEDCATYIWETYQGMILELIEDV